MPDEAWRPIPGYEGAYEVSDLGRVRSLDRMVQTSRGARRYAGRVRKSAPNGRTGHQFIPLQNRPLYVHRLVLTAFVGPCPDGMECCHNNGDPTDNRLVNLRWDTKSANSFDQVTHGTHPHARKTHCKYGHEFTVANTRIAPRGARLCRECERVWGVEKRRRRRNPARKCPVCWRPVSETRSSLIVQHRDKAWAPCPGSGQPYSISMPIESAVPA